MKLYTNINKLMRKIKRKNIISYLFLVPLFLFLAHICVTNNDNKMLCIVILFFILLIIVGIYDYIKIINMFKSSDKHLLKVIDKELENPVFCSPRLYTILDNYILDIPNKIIMSYKDIIYCVQLDKTEYLGGRASRNKYTYLVDTKGQKSKLLTLSTKHIDEVKDIYDIIKNKCPDGTIFEETTENKKHILERYNIEV